MKSIFADSFYYLAISNPKDDAHERAREFSAEYDGRIVTTAWALTEVADGFAAPRLRSLFTRLLAQIEADPKTTIIGPSQLLFRQGIELYSRRPDKEWSLTDCISFVVMRKRNLREALTGDQHFEQAGFKILLKGR